MNDAELQQPHKMQLEEPIMDGTRLPYDMPEIKISPLLLEKNGCQILSSKRFSKYNPLVFRQSSQDLEFL